MNLPKESILAVYESILISWHYYSCYDYKREKWCKNIYGKEFEYFRPLIGERLKLFHKLLEDIVIQHKSSEYIKSPIYDHIIQILLNKVIINI